MADTLRKTAEGVWTNAPDPSAPVEDTSGTRLSADGQSYEQYAGGKWIPISAAHNNTGPDQADPIIADARKGLEDLNAGSTQATEDTVNESMFPKASQAKRDYPGSYDHIVSSDDMAHFEDFLTQREKQAQLDQSLVGKAANAVVSPTGKAILGGGATLAQGLGPEVGGPVAIGAAGLEALANFLSTKYQTPNAPKSATDFAENLGEVAGPPIAGSLAGDAMGAVSKAVPALTNSRLGAGLGGAVGTYQGYNKGGTFTPAGIPGAIERGVEGAMGGGLVGKGLGFLRKAAAFAGLAPEAAVAEVPFENPGGPLPRDPHALSITTLGEQQVPEKSVDDVLMRSGKNYVPPRPFTPSPTPREYEFSPREPRSALNDISEEAVQRLAAQSGDVFKRMQADGAFDGDRTVNPSWSDSPAAQLMRERAARGIR